MESPRLRLKLIFEDGLTMGPGKADLLGFIDEEGSISAAGRRMKMSYKRAWMLVEEMNAAFWEPLVESSRGGTKGGGARLTDTGIAVLRHYRTLVDVTRSQGEEAISGISSLVRSRDG